MGLVWDEKTSNDVMPGGLMGTHDEATKEFFNGTNVHMLYVYRKKDRTNLITDAIYNTCYRCAAASYARIITFCIHTCST